jgi:hypothetical protein
MGSVGAHLRLPEVARISTAMRDLFMVLSSIG